MPSGFAELTVQAHQLVSSGDLAGAQELLSDALVDADPRPGNASPDLAEAAGLQARVLVALGEPHSARGWAAFTYSAMTRLYGQADQRTVAAAATLAAVLHRVGSHARAARLYQDVIIELTAVDGPESLRVLAAHADLATVEYARGECTVARNRLEDAWELHREVYGDGHPSGIKMLARLGAMQRDCGHFTEAHEHLALARELCRQYLAADDPLAGQVAALARAAASPDHVCADAPVTGLDEPAGPAGRATAGSEQQAGRHGPGDDPYDDDHDDPASHPGHVDHGDGRPDQAEPGYARHTGPVGYPSNADYPTGRYPDPTGLHVGATAERSQPGTPGPDQHDYPDYPDYPEQTRFSAERQPPDQHVDPVGRPPDQRTGSGGHHSGWEHAPSYPESGRQPAGPPPLVPNPRQPMDRPGHRPTSPVGERYADGPQDDDWWPPEGDEATHQPGTTVQRGAALPPAVAALTGPAADLDAPEGVRRVSNLPERRRSRLPVPIYHPPALRSGRMVPLAVAGVVVVLLGAAAVIAGVARVDDPDTPPPAPSIAPTGATPTPEASPPAGAAPGTPPTEVRLRDDRNSITLTWKYPAGAEGPVVISGGRKDQDPRAFQELPAGTAKFSVTGLSRSVDYCFTVAVVYSADSVGRAKPVCTDRR